MRSRADRSTAVDAATIGVLTREEMAGRIAALDFNPPRFLERIEQFATSLALWGRQVNLTATPDDPAELTFHILDSLMPLVVATRPAGSVFRELFGPGRTVLDLGSGAGFPGLVLAAASEARFVLLESRRKRASFLSVAAAAMELPNVVVDATRRNPLDLTPTFDVVVGRAFAKPAGFYRSAAAALRPQGRAVLYATPEQPLDLDAAAAAGLGGHLTVAYEVLRDLRPISRMLVVWQKPI